MDEKSIIHINFPVKIIGIGGGACRCIKKMVDMPLAGVEYCIVSNDEMDLKLVNENMLKLGLKSNCNPWEIEPCGSYIGYKQCYANEENEAKIKSIIDGLAKQVVIVAGFGGGLGSSGAIWITEICKRQNIPVTVICTIPFDFEGKRKRQRALDAIKSLEEMEIDVKVLYAEDLLKTREDMNFFNCFEFLDEYVVDTIVSLDKN